LIRRCRPHLGTYVEVRIERAAESTQASRAVEAAYRAIERVERLMSFHDPASELSQINAARAGDEIALHPWTVEVLALAKALHHASAGAFDCGVGRRLVEWSMLPRHLAARSQHALSDSSLAHMELLPGERIRIRRPICLDLGGIAKGYAVDKAVEELTAHGVASGVVNAGGDLRVLGVAAQPIHVRRPDDWRELAYLGALADGAVATSASYFSRRYQGRRWRCALVDMRTGAPIMKPSSYSVIAPTCAIADGLTKVVAADGDAASACLDRFDARAVVL